MSYDPDDREDDPEEMPRWWVEREGNCRVPSSEDLRNYSRGAHPTVHLDAWNAGPTGAPDRVIRPPEPLASAARPDKRPQTVAERLPRIRVCNPFRITAESARELGARGGRSRSPAKKLAALAREARKRTTRETTSGDDVARRAHRPGP